MEFARRAARSVEDCIGNERVARKEKDKSSLVQHLWIGPSSFGCTWKIAWNDFILSQCETVSNSRMLQRHCHCSYRCANLLCEHKISSSDGVLQKCTLSLVQFMKKTRDYWDGESLTRKKSQNKETDTLSSKTDSQPTAKRWESWRHEHLIDQIQWDSPLPCWNIQL